MRRERLRPAWSEQELAELYPEPHQHTRWMDHRVRVAVTTELARGVTYSDPGVESVADLSCGDATIARALYLPAVYLGDLAAGHRYEGPLEQTLTQVPCVGLFILSETLEHLDDPDKVLVQVRAKTRYLVVTTPIGAWGDVNEEHYWAWDREAVQKMLAGAGFTVLAYNELDMTSAWSPYCFGMWVCS